MVACFVLIAENGEKRPNLDIQTLVYIKWIILQTPESQLSFVVRP